MTCDDHRHIVTASTFCERIWPEIDVQGRLRRAGTGGRAVAGRCRARGRGRGRSS